MLTSKITVERCTPSRSTNLTLFFFWYQIDGLVHRLVALINSKLSAPNGAFAYLTEICVANLTVKSTQSRWGVDSLDPWLGDLARACEEANVKIHIRSTSTSMDGASLDPFPCRSCHPSQLGSLDSAPVIPDAGD